MKRALEPRVLTVLGVLLIAGGCALLGVGWGLAAGETLVSVQMPYVFSAALPGVGLVVVGVGLVIVGARESDARARRQQQAELLTLLGLLRDEVTALRDDPAPKARRTRKATQ
jgi:hypothetical protein